MTNTENEKLLLPVPLPLTWHLYSVVHCPQCGEFMHMKIIGPRKNLEREAHCITANCPQNAVTYITRIEVDGLVITGVK